MVAIVKKFRRTLDTVEQDAKPKAKRTMKEVNPFSRCGDATRLRNNPIRVTLPTVKGLSDEV